MLMLCCYEMINHEKCLIRGLIMNISKEKEILELRKQLQALENQFKEQDKTFKDNVSNQLLNAAEQMLVEYLSKQEFKIDTKQSDKGHVVARLDGIWVSVTRNPRTLSIRMSNGEDYSISVESTAVSLDVYGPKKNQDAEIDGWKKLKAV